MSPGDALTFLLYFFLILVILHYFFLPLAPWYARIVSFLTGCPSYGDFVVCGYHRFQILPECMGIVSLSLFFALLRYFQLPLRRWRVYVFGALALLLFNLMRVYVLVKYTSSFFSFDILHTLFWLVDPVAVVLYVRWLMG